LKCIMSRRKREEVARMSIRAHNTRGSLVIFVKQCRPRWGKPKLDGTGLQALGDLGG
jgi:hypothetical protein